MLRPRSAPARPSAVSPNDRRGPRPWSRASATGSDSSAPASRPSPASARSSPTPLTPPGLPLPHRRRQRRVTHRNRVDCGRFRLRGVSARACPVRTLPSMERREPSPPGDGHRATVATRFGHGPPWHPVRMCTHRRVKKCAYGESILSVIFGNVLSELLKNRGVIEGVFLKWTI